MVTYVHFILDLTSTTQVHGRVEVTVQPTLIDMSMPQRFGVSSQKRRLGPDGKGPLAKFESVINQNVVTSRFLREAHAGMPRIVERDAADATTSSARWLVVTEVKQPIC